MLLAQCSRGIGLQTKLPTRVKLYIKTKGSIRGVSLTGGNMVEGFIIILVEEFTEETGGKTRRVVWSDGIFKWGQV